MVQGKESSFCFCSSELLYTHIIVYNFSLLKFGQNVVDVVALRNLLVHMVWCLF